MNISNAKYALEFSLLHISHFVDTPFWHDALDMPTSVSCSDIISANETKYTLRFLKRSPSFFFCLSNEAFNCSDYTATNDNLWIMNWKGCVRKRSWPYLKLATIFTYAWKYCENHEKPQSGYLAFGPRFKSKTSRIWSRSANFLTGKFGVRGTKCK
jgi:hypothetical protein